jgi:NTP pyrophosphatase (non-canonical NTP hydrolase)
MRDLSDLLTLPEMQTYVQEFITEKGFDKETVEEKFLIFIEEVGEMAKAARKMSAIKTDKNSSEHSIEEEAADVLFVLLVICNKLGVNLEEAFKAKDKKNRDRVWN